MAQGAAAGALAIVAAPAGPLCRVGGGTEAPIELPQPGVPELGLRRSGCACSVRTAGQGQGGRSLAAHCSSFTKVLEQEGRSQQECREPRGSLGALGWTHPLYLVNNSWIGQGRRKIGQDKRDRLGKRTRSWGWGCSDLWVPFSPHPSVCQADPKPNLCPGKSVSVAGTRPIWQEHTAVVGTTESPSSASFSLPFARTQRAFSQHPFYFTSGTAGDF